ncbi:Uncharacterised protein [Klebsiella pneumoniae]|nr:Uncharacterised protein [Klebsiella pneumoniae]
MANGNAFSESLPKQDSHFLHYRWQAVTLAEKRPTCCHINHRPMLPCCVMQQDGYGGGMLN